MLARTRTLERDVREWLAALKRIGEARDGDVGALPARLRASIEEPGESVDALRWRGPAPGFELFARRFDAALEGGQ